MYASFFRAQGHNWWYGHGTEARQREKHGRRARAGCRGGCGPCVPLVTPARAKRRPRRSTARSTGARRRLPLLGLRTAGMGFGAGSGKPGLASRSPSEVRVERHGVPSQNVLLTDTPSERPARATVPYSRPVLADRADDVLVVELVAQVSVPQACESLQPCLRVGKGKHGR